MLLIDKHYSVSRSVQVASRYRLIAVSLMLISLMVILSMPLHAGESSAYAMRHFQLENMKEVSLAPAFELPTIGGEQRKLDDYRGQVVVVNFWSTWCIPCRTEMPSLQRAWQKLEPAGVVVLGVAIQDDPSMVERFIKDSGVTFPILMDKEGDISSQWPFSGIPATFVLDQEGRILYRAMGLREWDSDEIINRVLAVAKPQ